VGARVLATAWKPLLYSQRLASSIVREKSTMLAHCLFVLGTATLSLRRGSKNGCPRNSKKVAEWPDSVDAHWFAARYILMEKLNRLWK
jgi:hypothetical protein